MGTHTPNSPIHSNKNNYTLNIWYYFVPVSLLKVTTHDAVKGSLMFRKGFIKLNVKYLIYAHLCVLPWYGQRE